MVSFFGLKFGADKKKGQLKQGDRKGQGDWRGDDKSNGQSLPNARQNDPLRPTTSYSTKGANNWRQTFKGLGGNSSMVDLSAPMRKQSMSSLRMAPSESNLRGQWSNSSTANLPLPTALGGPGVRVGTPERPSTSSRHTKEWVNPLDVHFGKDSFNTAAGSQSIAPAPKSPLAVEINADEVSDANRDSENTQSSHSSKPLDKYRPANHTNGYPSPPQSINNGDQTLSPVTPDLANGSGRTNGPAGASSLPSPAASAPRTSEERWDLPVIRNVMAKRDTTTFHSPRRRSFTKDVEVEELERLRKQQQTEGFAGNFSDFNFGETVTRQPSHELQPERKTGLGGPGTERQEPPKALPAQEQAISRHIAPFLCESPEPPKAPERRYSGPQLHLPSKESSPLLGAGIFEEFPPAPVDKPIVVPARPVTSYGATRRARGPPAAAAGAHPGNGVESFAPPPPPLGFRARLGSDASTRRKTGPPRPLRPAAELLSLQTEPTIRSPADRPPSEKSIPAPETPKASLDKSPVSAYRKPIEGDFPVTKGLPRGRQPQPPRRPPRSDEAVAPGKPDFTTPNWNGFNPAEPRHSAIPPPLSPAKQGQHAAPSLPTPQLPSPSFASLGSLELSISNSGDSLSKAFEEALGQTSLDEGFGSDLFALESKPSIRSTHSTATRVEARKAPPRPPPITLPPSPTKSAGPATKSPVPAQGEFQTAFF